MLIAQLNLHKQIQQYIANIIRVNHISIIQRYGLTNERTIKMSYRVASLLKMRLKRNLPKIRDGLIVMTLVTVTVTVTLLTFKPRNKNIILVEMYGH